MWKKLHWTESHHWCPRPTTRDYYNQHLLNCLGALYRYIIPDLERHEPVDNLTTFVAVWDNVHELPPLCCSQAVICSFPLKTYPFKAAFSALKSVAYYFLSFVFIAIWYVFYCWLFLLRVLVFLLSSCYCEALLVPWRRCKVLHK